VQTTDSVENIFARAWTLLSSNPVIVVPGTIVGIIVGVIGFLVVPHVGMNATNGDPGEAIDALARVAAAGAILGAVGVVAFLITQTYVVGMAGSAWRNGTATLADGAAAFSTDAGRVLLTLLLLGVIGIVLAVLTAGLGWLVFMFFSIYTLPAVIIDKMAPFDALKRSFSLATDRWVPTLIIIVVLFAIGLAIGFLTIPLRFIPLLGPIIGEVIKQACVAYAMLVIVGEYLAPAKLPSAPVPPGPTA